MKPTRLFDILDYQLKKKPLEVSFATKKNGQWEKESTVTFMNQVNKMSRGFLKMGIQIGEKIGLIITNNCTEWHILDYAIQQIGAVSAPVYSTISNDDTIYILNQAEVKFCFVSDQVIYNKIQSIKSHINSLIGLYSFDVIPNSSNWHEVMNLGEDDSNQKELELIKSRIQNDDLATLIYTSGTTGKPKAVMLTHKNILSNVLASDLRVPDPKTQEVRILSFLPICHIFERMITYLYQYNSYAIYFAESIETIGDNLKEVQPHFFTAVPRLIEKIYTNIYTAGMCSFGLKRKIFIWAMKQIRGWNIHSKKTLAHKIADRIVFKKWRKCMGGNVICIISGSATLSPRLNTIFHAAGIPILEGYGLTETSPVISVNSLGKNGIRIGSVGKPLDNLHVKIAKDGEILVKGDSITKGYFKNFEENNEILCEEGYFKTGDIGEIKEGFLYITDRKKEIFKTSGGKYIAPQKIEIDSKQSNFIEQIMVVGDGEKMPCALIQPAYDFIEIWTKVNGYNIGNDYFSICSSEKVKEAISKEIDQMNKKLGHWEQIKKFELTPTLWSVDGGELTPTLKLKRKIIKEKYQLYYNKLYM